MNALLPKLIGSLLNILSWINPQKASQFALSIFQKPRKGKHSSTSLAFLDTATNKTTLFYTTYAIETYFWKGRKSTILLAHGWESNAARWQNQIKILHSQGYSVVALDAPAHGASGSKSFDALLYANFIKIVSHNFKPEFFMGHSVGGLAIMYFLYSAKYTNVKKIVLLGVPNAFQNILKRYKELLGYNAPICSGIDSEVELRFGHPPSFYSTAKFAQSIQAQGLIIHDLKDPIIPYSDAIEIGEYFNNSTTLSTEGYGHALKTKFVIDHVVEFFNS